MMLRVFLVLGLIVISSAKFDRRNVAEISEAGIPEHIITEGYAAERHHVTTPDGYILEMHRLPCGRHQGSRCVAGRPVAFLMHGLMAASSSYVAIGPEFSIGYNLADAGFDVWMGNARGNRPSRNHVSLDPDHTEQRFDFFDFSWEEIGMIDLPTMIDYVLEFTGQAKLHYVGHSQGGTSFLVMATMRPEYNDKLTTVHLLAGVGYMANFPNIGLTGMALLTDVLWSAALNIGFVEVIPPSWIPFDESAPESTYSRADFCTGDFKTKYMCELTGVKELLSEADRMDVLLFFGGAALKQIAHYGQNVRDRRFRRWNYGLIENLAVYGTLLPPEYDLSLVTADVIMHYTVADTLLDERDVIAMAADMPNTRVRKVADETFGHADFAFSPDVKELVTDYMIEYMVNAERRQ